MKCINCDASNNLKDRTANMGKCKSCNHEFAFEPTLMPESNRLTDTFFAKLISDISVKGTLFFTPNQLYYLLNKRLKFRSRNVWTGIIVITGGFIFAFLIIILILCIGEQILSRIVGTIGLAIAATLLYLDRNRQQDRIFDNFSMDRVQFDTWLNKWASINNQPPTILPSPQNFSLPAVANPEVTAYSFDRAVVCDTPEIAQLLISNNFHFENNCAILTIDGYPQNIFDTTMEMLHRNPDLKVYAFHNCSPKGIELPHRLRAEEKWFPNPAIAIIDVGILPRQIIDNFNLTILRSPESAEISQRLALNIRANLNPAEIAWLDAGCYLELESLSPRKIIHILQRAINERRELTAIEGDDMVVIDRPNFYTVDSFG
jgi:hypothetical protein